MGKDRQYAGTIHNPFHEKHRSFPLPVGDDESIEETATKYFAGDKRLWTKQPLNRPKGR